MRNHVALAPALLFFLILSFVVPSARADTYTFQFTSSTNPALALSATGTLTTVTAPSTPGSQRITGLSGTLINGALTGNFNPVAISLVPIASGTTASNPSSMVFQTGIDPTNGKPSSFNFTYDNLYSPAAASFFDVYGLAFKSADNVYYDLAFSNGNYVYEAFNNSESFDQRTYGPNLPAVDVQIPAPAASAVTPEPSSFALLGTGLLAAASFARRRIRA